MHRSIGSGFLICGVCLSGCWTLFCYALVLAEASFNALKTWSFVPLIFGVALGSLCAREPVLSSREGMARPTNSWGRTSVPTTTALALLALVIVVVVLRIADTAFGLAWVALLGATALVFRSSALQVMEAAEAPASLMRWQRIAAACLVFLGAMLVLVSHRPDLDDGLYLNLVVTPLDFPSEPLLSRSGLWQDLGAPLELPIYRLHTYELLVALLSDLFHVDHKIVYYLLLAPLFGGIAVVVHWVLARFLLPRHALAVLLAWFVLMIALGETHREFGNFAFVRLFQSKSILVTVLLPLCLWLGLRFAEQPDWRRALALGLAVIASLGMSSSALATTPFIVAAALSGGLLGARRSTVNTVLGGLGSVLVLAVVGLALALEMLGIGKQSYGDIAPSTANGLSIVLGEGPLGALVLALFPIAPLFVSDARRRKLYTLATASCVLLLLNPWVAPLLATQLDSALFWRVLWAVPLVFSAALSLAALAARAAARLPHFAQPVVLPALLAGVLLLSGGWSLSPENRVLVTFPHYKVEAGPYAIAAEIVRRAPPRSTIYATANIAHLIPTFRVHPYPLIVRLEYSGFATIRHHFGDEELIRRRRVLRFLEGSDQHPSTPAFFRAQLDVDKPAFVAYEKGTEWAPAIGGALTSAGYVPEARGKYWLWHPG